AQSPSGFRRRHSLRRARSGHGERSSARRDPACPGCESMSGSISELTRWRLILGDAAESACDGAGCRLDARGQAMDAALEWLYGRDPKPVERHVMRRGGREASLLSTPTWINEIHRLFPKETIERLEKDAIERFAIEGVITSPEVLARAEPN